MKCPKCNGDKGQWDIGNYHWYPCDSCHETGEVVGNSEQLKSRSVQRREALQKGEPMPQFDKPEMPEMIWAFAGGEWFDNNTGDTEYLRADKVRELARFAEACWQQLDGLLARGSSDIDYDDEIKMRDEKLDWRESLGLLDALFPEGLESEVKDE